ncbi:hypothetical protein VM98_38085, partial [Streptomyces rubellomurinus subsp. indigoferus]
GTAESAATLRALAAFPARAAVLLYGPRGRVGAGVGVPSRVGLTARTGTSMRARSRSGGAGGTRRLGGELTVLAVTVAAVAGARRRGRGDRGAASDPRLIAGPLL